MNTHVSIARTAALGRAVRVVAIYEGLKSALVLALASGLLTLVHRHLHEIAVRLLQHAHLDPAAKYSRIFLDAAAHLQDSRLVLLAAAAIAYAVLHLVEAYGLWFHRAWAEVLAAGSAAIYLPVEIYELLQHATGIRAAFLIANTVVVAVMIASLFRRRRAAPDPVVIGAAEP